MLYFSPEYVIDQSDVDDAEPSEPKADVPTNSDENIPTNSDLDIATVTDAGAIDELDMSLLNDDSLLEEVLQAST